MGTLETEENDYWNENQKDLNVKHTINKTQLNNLNDG
jgi:hypothetical protein